MRIRTTQFQQACTTIFVLQLCFFAMPACASTNCQESYAQHAAGQTEVPSSNVSRICVAEGEYEITTENGIGPFTPAVYGFRESWTLWRLPDGSFEVTGARNYRSPSTDPHNNEFDVRLTPDFKMRNLTEFRKLEWRSDSGPITCDFFPRKIYCTSNAKHSDNVTLDLPMDNAFGFLWPISAFSLGSITRAASHDPGTLTPVDLIRVEEASVSDPIMATVLSGHLKYLGQEQLQLAGRTWQADKFELKVPLHAAFSLWTSPEGLLLAFGTESKTRTLPADALVLVRFHQWADWR